MRRRAAGKSYHGRGELNRLVDSLCHPLFEDRPWLIFIDAFLHGLVERNPPLTVRRFLRYSLPLLMEEWGGKPSGGSVR